MPDWSALRRHARTRHMQLRRYLSDHNATDYDAPLPTAADLLAAAEAETGVMSLALSPDDALLAGAHAVLDRATPCIWFASGRGIQTAWQNFARAHEFGHYWLHPELEMDACAVEDGPDGIATDTERSGGTQTEVGYSPAERREKEADLFAAELLLPAPFVRRAFIDQRWTAGQIAAHVGVPESCALSQLASALLLPTREEQTETHLAFGQGNELVPIDPLLLLDASQREAAIIERGPVLIDAGPGTGKTRTLVARLAYLLHEQAVAPENILALTFSNLAAEEMRTRLRQTVGPIAERVWIGTFHAFGLELLRKDGHRIGLPTTPALLETADAVALLEQHLDQLPLHEYEYLSLPILPFPDILQCISRAKDELKTPDDYLEMATRELAAAGADDKRRLAAQKSLEVAGIYAAYQRLLAAQGMVDFGDLLMRAVELLDNCADVRERWQEQFQFILADEYQDINRASAQMLRRLAGEGHGFWAVGDLRQAIYRFRGASPANVRDFALDFPGGRRLQLRHNYRSQPELVSLFGAFAGQMDAADTPGVVWQAQRPHGDGPAITLAIADDEEAQADGIAATIQLHTVAGVSLREQAILCHTNRQAAELAERLELRGVATQHLGPLLEREETRDLLSVLSLACEPDGAALARVARFPAYAVPDADVQRLLSAAREQKLPFPQALALSAGLQDLSPEGKEGLMRLYAELHPIAYRPDAWKLLCAYLFETSDYLRPLLEDVGSERAGSEREGFGIEGSRIEAAKRRLAIYQLLITAQGLARRFQKEGENGRTAFLAYLRLLLACGQERSIRPPAEVSEIDGVRIMTIHQSKGLEFPVVYLPNLVEGQFPPRRGSRMATPPAELLRGADIAAETDDAESASEECLFFVALSRARDQLVLSRPAKLKSRQTKPCQMLTQLEPLLGSAAVDGIHWPNLTLPVQAPAIASTAPMIVQPPPTYSLSALEQYQRCPRQFYYQRIARLPQRDADSPYLAFHLSMRQTLDWLQAEQSAERSPDELSIEQQFADIWESHGEVTQTGLGRVLRRRASGLLRQARSSVNEAHQPQAKQMLTAALEHGNVQLACDQTEDLPDGTLRLVDYTTRRPQDDDHTAPRLALLRHAARQQHRDRPIQVVIGNLHSGEQKEVTESKRWEPARVEKYNAALLSIRSGNFPADPEPRKCAMCPFFLICPT